MTDMTLKDFCKQFGACRDGYEYGCSLTETRGDAMMSEVWPLMDNRDYMFWVISRDGVLTDKSRVEFAVRCIRETPIGNGKTVFDLLTDKRSINAVIVCEKFVKGEATYADVNAAARAAAYAAHAAYAAYAAAYAAAAAAYASAYAAYASAYAADGAYASAYAAHVAYATYVADGAASAKQLEILKSIPNPFKE